MAGNVSEWTDTWTEEKTFPIIKGGSYRSQDVRLDQQIADHHASQGEEWIGFRTVRRNVAK
jgi:formylglycine-generating enzyme required for sulfatase activity